MFMVLYKQVSWYVLNQFVDSVAFLLETLTVIGASMFSANLEMTEFHTVLYMDTTIH